MSSPFFRSYWTLDTICIILLLHLSECLRNNLSEGGRIEGGGLILPKNLKNGHKTSKSISDRYSHEEKNIVFKVGNAGSGHRQNDESSNRVVFDNSFGRYGGGKELFGNPRSIQLFDDTSNNWRPFSKIGGSGFAGKAESGIALIEAFHLYKQYKAMM